MEPRIWLGLAVAALLASVVPYWYWIGPAGFVLCAVLALAAVATLWLNVRGEHRLTREAITAADDDQRRTDGGAPAATSAAGTSTEPSSRW